MSPKARGSIGVEVDDVHARDTTIADHGAVVIGHLSAISLDEVVAPAKLGSGLPEGGE